MHHPSFLFHSYSDPEDGIVTFRVDGIEQAAHFILRQEIDGGRCPAWACCA
jgi:hypothetical protein